MIKFKCSNCNHQIDAPEKYAGKRVRCPKCKAPIHVPESVGKTGTQKPELIKFRCPTCNQKIGIATGYAGKRARCAKCKNPLIVPQASSQSGPPVVKDETKVLRAGQEQRPAEEGIWGDLGSMDELLLEETKIPSVEKQMEQRPADYETDESQFSAYAERKISSDRPKKKRSAIFIGGACVLAILLAGIIVWSFIPGTGESEIEAIPPEVQKFAEDYIGLLNKGEIDKAKALLSPDLQVDIENSDFAELAEHLSRSNISELGCRAKGIMESPTEGNQFCLYYDFRYEGQKQRILLLVAEIDNEFAVSGIAAREPFGEALTIGPHSFEELMDIALTAAATRIKSIFTKFFCGFMVVILVAALLQVTSMWIVFEKAGEPGWAILVPVYSTWVLAEVGGKPGWLGLLMCLSGVIPYVGPLVGLGLSLVISIGVAKAFDRGAAFGVGLTLVPIVFYPILAFASD